MHDIYVRGKIESVILYVTGWNLVTPTEHTLKVTDFQYQWVLISKISEQSVETTQTPAAGWGFPQHDIYELSLRKEAGDLRSLLMTP